LGNPTRVLIAGESWIMHTIHQKGFDSFTTTAYGEGHQFLSAALKQSGFDVEHLPNHLAAAQFPSTAAELEKYDVVVLSDIGSNTLLLHPDTFERSMSRPNRLELLRNWVDGGGGLVMVGGYLTFQGIDAKARYAGTAVEEALPVRMLTWDDRVEAPQGLTPRLGAETHPITAGLAADWPVVLGYNRFTTKPNAATLATIGSDPFLAAWEFGSGRATAFASDCGPHWLSPAFLAWDGYGKLWTQLIAWTAGRI
jgi:uncharacterized membrane protein